MSEVEAKEYSNGKYKPLLLLLILRVINHWDKLQREVVHSPSLSFLMTSFLLRKDR